MPRKESEAVPEGNGPSPSKNNSGLVNPRWRIYIDFLKKDSIDSRKEWTAFSTEWTAVSIDGTGSWTRFRMSRA